MKTILSLEKKHKRSIPERFQSNDDRFSDTLVEWLISKYTKKGDHIFDPFTGLGTTLLIAEEMERIPFGIEYNEDRYSFVKSQLKTDSTLIHGDALKLDSYAIPKFDLCITSPPYMHQHETTNPLTNHATAGTYFYYLQDLKSIFERVETYMNPQANIIIEVSNLKNDADVVTTLAWDLASTLQSFLKFLGEIIISWKQSNSKNDEIANTGTYGYGYDHSYCLIFSQSEEE